MSGCSFVTPDDDQPAEVEELGDDRVTWFNFRALSDAIDDLLADAAAHLPDREAFLLRELQQLFEADGLLSLPEDVVIVAARFAYPFYRRHRVYRCPAGRSFRDGLKYLGFYTDKAIKPEVPKILGRFDDEVVSDENAARYGGSQDPIERRLAEAIRATLNDDPEMFDWKGQFFVLSAPDDAETLMLGAPIVREEKGAWMQGGQRYVTSEALAAARTTADLTTV